MLHTSELVAIPNDSGYNQKKGQYINRYIYLQHYRVKKEGDTKVRHKVLLIGRIVKDPKTGVDCLMPNDNYYKHYGKKPKPNSVLKGPGASSKLRNDSCNGNNSEQEILGFGLGIACFKIAQETKLERILTEIFGAETAQDLLGLAMFYCDDYVGLTELEDFSSEQMSFTDRFLTPQIASDLFKSITEENRENFFKQWIPLQKQADVVCYDLKSISSHSQSIDSKENFLNFNIGIFTNIATGMPIAYESYNGNINDFTNFSYVQEKVISWGLKRNFVLAIDGACTEDFSINFTMFKEHDLILGVPIDHMTKVRKRFIEWRKSNTDHLSIAKYRFENSITCKEEEFELASEVKGRLLLYFSTEKYNFQCTSLQSNIELQKTILQELSTISKKEAKKFMRYFDLKINDDQTFSYEIKTDALADDLLTCGSFAIMTTSKTITPETILSCYCNKEIIEKRFKNIKHEIIGERSFVHSTDSCRGKLFILFISLIIRTHLSVKLKDWIRKNNYSLLGCIHQLKNIQCKKYRSNWIPNKALTPKQKEIVKILELPIHTIKNKST